jgi:hypothetical protein
MCIGLGLTFGVSATALVARKAGVSQLGRERDRTRRNTLQARIHSAQRFESRLKRALDMAKADVTVFELVTQDLGDTAPHVRAGLLLADSRNAPRAAA